MISSVASQDSVVDLAVIGAGLAGTAFAASLRQRGYEGTILLLEAGRGPGGRSGGPGGCSSGPGGCSRGPGGGPGGPGGGSAQEPTGHWKPTGQRLARLARSPGWSS